MESIKNALKYQHFVFISLCDIYNKKAADNYYNGSICIINNILFQFKSVNDQLYFEPLNEEQIKEKKINAINIHNVINPSEVIGIMIYDGFKIFHYKFKIPEVVTQEKIIVK